MARIGLPLCLATVWALLESGSCLRCYQCNSLSDPTCKDPFYEAKNTVDCNTKDSFNYNRQNLADILPPELSEAVDGAPRFCYKIVMHNGATIRTCLDGNPLDPNQSCRLFSKMPVQPYSSTQIKFCSVCGEDLCNGDTTY